jgi:hypothetical protein
VAMRMNPLFQLLTYCGSLRALLESNSGPPSFEPPDASGEANRYQVSEISIDYLPREQ